MSQVSSLVANFNVLTFKCGLTSPKIAKIGIFWYKFTQKGYAPFKRFFTNFGLKESPRSMPSCQISPLWSKQCGLTGPKIANNGKFCYKFAQRENSGGPQKFEKVHNYKRSIYAMTPLLSRRSRQRERLSASELSICLSVC